jgi:hypothetical protein
MIRLAPDFGVGKLSDLAIVKSTGNGKVVNVGVSAGSHLKLLNRADTTLGVEDGNRHILLSSKTVDSSGSGLKLLGYYRIRPRMTHITTCRTNNSQMVSVLALLTLVLSREKVFEEVTEELQSAILEGVARAVEELEEV